MTAKKCSVCGLEDGAALGHVVIDSVQAKEPTCTEEGLVEGTCKICGEVIAQSIEMVEHTPSDVKVSVDATYYESGKKTVSCLNCATVLQEEAYELTEAEKEKWYKDNCGKFDYKEVARNTDEYIGDLVTFTCEVSIIVNEAEDGKESVYWANTKKSYGWYSDDPVYIMADSSEYRILENDVVTFYGEIVELYDDWMGKYPLIKAYYYDVKG